MAASPILYGTGQITLDYRIHTKFDSENVSKLLAFIQSRPGNMRPESYSERAHKDSLESKSLAHASWNDRLNRMFHVEHFRFPGHVFR